MKTKGKKKMVEGESKYEEDHSSSDEEAPEVVSNSAMESNLKTLQKELANLKQNLRQAEKTKRRNRQELFIAQKKAKLNNVDAPEDEDAPEDNANLGNKQVDSSDDIKPARPKRKVYSSFNVIVEPLSKSDNVRAAAALDFKSRRLAKVPRESVKTAVISYNRKLQARK